MIDRFVFTAMSGAKSAMGQLATTSHNMANLQTPGFRQMLSSGRAVPVTGANADSRAFVIDSTPGADWTPGAVTATGNPLDAALQNEGMFAVQRSDGQEAYTRAGKFHLDAQGYWSTLRHTPCQEKPTACSLQQKTWHRWTIFVWCQVLWKAVMSAPLRPWFK